MRKGADLLREVNTRVGASKGLLDYVSALELDLVAVNQRGQAIANTRAGQRVAYFIDPVGSNVPEPSVSLIALFGAIAVFALRREV